MIVCTVMYVLVVAALAAALAGRRRRLTVEGKAHHQTSPLLRPALAGWVALVSSGWSA